MADSNNDAILLPLLEATEERQESYLSELVSEHAEPVIQKIVSYRLRISFDHANTKESWDAADICGNAMMQLLSHLSKFRKNPHEHPIRDFRGYAAVIAHHACNQYFRDKYPKRTQLNNKLRYLLNHNLDFALWTIENRLVCGLSHWQNNLAPATRAQEFAGTIRHMREKPAEEQDPAKLAKVLKNVFQLLGQPLFFDDLVTIIVDVFNIREQTQAEESRKRTENLLEQIEDQRADTATTMEHRLYLENLWKEMIDLPLRQRTALLLSMRDHEGSSVLYLFPLTRISSILAIAESLTIAEEDLAALWSKLPLEDNDIAARLGVNRQQVINLRRSARERLARRMKHY